MFLSERFQLTCDVNIYNISSRNDSMSRQYWDRWQSHVREKAPASDMPFLKELLQRGITTVLDVGSGSGISSKGMAFLGFRVTCVDYSLEAVRRLQHLAQDHDLPHLNVVCADLLWLPFRDESFGAVTASMVMNFFTDERERERAFKEVFRVLKPGGVVLLVVLSCDDEGAKTGVSLGNGNVELPDGIRLHYFTPKELEALVGDMTIREIACFQEEDTVHHTPHTHDLIRLLVSFDR